MKPWSCDRCFASESYTCGAKDCPARPRTFAEAVADLNARPLKIVPLTWPKPLGSLTVEQEGAVVAVEEFDRVALDTNLAPRGADLRVRTLHVGAELWPELLRDLDLGPKIRPDLDGIRRKC